MIIPNRLRGWEKWFRSGRNGSATGRNGCEAGEMVPQPGGMVPQREEWLRSGRKGSAAGRNDLTGAAISTFKPESTADLNAFLHDYADAIASRQFYVEVLKNLLQQFQHNIGQIDDREKVNHLFKRTYLSCLISKSKSLQDQASQQIYRARHNGATRA